MPEIRIRLLGDAACKNRMNLSEGFLYDVPVDSLGIPCVPLSELVPEDIIRDFRVGFAFPAGYLGMVREANRLAKLMPDIQPQIRACFTGRRFCPEEGGWVRFLRAGQVFCAGVYGHDSPEVLEALKDALASVTRVGADVEGISGLAECSLAGVQLETSSRMFPGCSLPCNRLEYTLMPVTPMCIPAPYADDSGTAMYVPGPVLREALEKDAGVLPAEKLRNMTFTNAYISDVNERLLPLPLCMSLVKLDKSQLHYRLSSGKDPNRVDQDVSPGEAYARNFESFLTTYTRPETERILSRDGAMYDALCRGQMFKGTICGEDEDLRALYRYLLARPGLLLGHLTQEGFGQVYLSAELLPADSLMTECLAKSFDVSCLSPALIMGRTGVPDTTAQGLLGEVERLLRAPGKLRIVDRYMDVKEDFSWNSRWGQEGPVVRLVAKGSVLRLATRDGLPVDISPVLHAFVGEQTKDGYGEILAYPAVEGYYRAAGMVPPEKYGIKLPLNMLSHHYAAGLADQVIRQVLKERVQGLAMSDRDDFRKGGNPEESLPMDLLRIMRERLAPEVPDELLARWYLQGLEEDGNGFDYEA